MTDLNLTDLLERAADEQPVGPPPVADMVRRAGRVRRHRGWAVVAGVAVATASVVAGAVLVTGPDGRRPADPTGAVDRSQVAVEGTWAVQRLLDAGGRQVRVAERYRGALSLVMHDGWILGEDGCNSLNGTYRQSEDGRSLRLPDGTAIVTQVGCGDEPPLYRRLRDVRGVRPSDGGLTLTDADGRAVADLRRESWSLTEGEYAAALRLARARLRGQDATVDRVSAAPMSGPDADCSSARLLQVTIVGRFPRLVTTGTPGRSGEVRALVVTADAATGQACAVGVRTGRVRPGPHATPVLLRPLSFGG